MIKSTIPIDFVLPAEGKVEGYIVVRINNESKEWTIHAEFSGQIRTKKIDKSKLKIEECK